MMFDDDDDMICYFCAKCKDVRYFYVVVKFVCPKNKNQQGIPFFPKHFSLSIVFFIPLSSDSLNDFLLNSPL